MGSAVSRVVYSGALGVLSVVPGGRWSIDWGGAAREYYGLVCGSGESCGYVGLLVFLSGVFSDSCGGYGGLGDDGGHGLVSVNRVVGELGLECRVLGDDADCGRRLLFCYPDVGSWRMRYGSEISLGVHLDDSFCINVDYDSGDVWFVSAGYCRGLSLGPVPCGDALMDVARIVEQCDNAPVAACGLLVALMNFLGVGSSGCRVQSDVVEYARNVVDGLRVGGDGRFLNHRERLYRLYR